MKKLIIKFVNIDEVKNFIALNTKKNYDIDISLGRYVIDAKSIMGIFQLDLANPVNVILHTDNEQEIASYEEELNKIFGR